MWVNTSYWLNPTMMDVIYKIQDYLQSNPVIGKVLSIGTVVRIPERLTRGKLDASDLALILVTHPAIRD